MKKLPRWIIYWLIVSMIITTWDSLFVILRPWSFADGPLGFIWLPYARYVHIDLNYLDLNNTFILSLPIMNFFEIGLALYALYENAKGKVQAAILLAFSSLLLTFAKTLTVFAVEAAAGFQHIRHNNAFTLMFEYALPNLPWVIFPFFALLALGSTLLQEH